MKHKYDCEIWQAADLLKDIHKWDEMLKEQNRDTWKEFGWDIVQPMEELVEVIDDHMMHLIDDARMYANQCECLEDELYYARAEIDELKAKLEAIHQAIESIND